MGRTPITKPTKNIGKNKKQKIHDKTVVSHCCLHRPPFMCIYPRQRLMYDIPVDIGHMAPVTPPALWGSGEVMFLVWPLPATPPMSPRTPEGPPPTTPTEAFLPGTPPGPPPPTPPLCVTLWLRRLARERFAITGPSRNWLLCMVEVWLGYSVVMAGCTNGKARLVPIAAKVPLVLYNTLLPKRFGCIDAGSTGARSGCNRMTFTPSSLAQVVHLLHPWQCKLLFFRVHWQVSQWHLYHPCLVCTQRPWRGSTPIWNLHGHDMFGSWRTRSSLARRIDGQTLKRTKLISARKRWSPMQALRSFNGNSGEVWLSEADRRHSSCTAWPRRWQQNELQDQALSQKEIGRGLPPNISRTNRWSCTQMEPVHTRPRCRASYMTMSFTRRSWCATAKPLGWNLITPVSMSTSSLMAKRSRSRQVPRSLIDFGVLSAKALRTFPDSLGSRFCSAKFVPSNGFIGTGGKGCWKPLVPCCNASSSSRMTTRSCGQKTFADAASHFAAYAACTGFLLALVCILHCQTCIWMPPAFQPKLCFIILQQQHPKTQKICILIRLLHDTASRIRRNVYILFLSMPNSKYVAKICSSIAHLHPMAGCLGVLGGALSINI